MGAIGQWPTLGPRQLAKGSVLIAALGLAGCAQTVVPWFLKEQETAQTTSNSTSLINADRDRFDVNQPGAALKFEPGAAARPAETMITLLHGMGPYPAKANWEGAFERLAAHHDASVLLFHWPAWVDIRTLPTVNADASGPAFAAYLEALAELQLSDGYDARFPKRSLLVHSMGSRVLKSALDGYQGGLPSDLFSSIVFISAEVDLAGHADWLETIDFASNVYVLVNGRDDVLDAPTLFYGRSRLGADLIRADGVQEPLARNAIYIRTDAGSRWHSNHLTRRSDELARLFVWMVAGARPADFSPLLQPTDQPNLFNLVEETR